MNELKSLGSGSTIYPKEYSPQVLERIRNPHSNVVDGHDLLVKLECPEFTSLCEVTQQPDFGSIIIRYRPNLWLVESKSLKLYLFSYRNHMAFHETAVGMIGKDLVTLLDPFYIHVEGFFNPRGGISIKPTYSYHQPPEAL
jgi:7-cyano-7-deazaguanine reductase